MAVLHLPPSVLHTQAVACRQQWLQTLQGNSDKVVLIDASALVEFDSSVLALLLACRCHMVQAGGRLQLAGMPPRLRELAAVYGVLTLLEA